MSFLNLWSTYFTARALARQQHAIGVALLDGQQRMMATRRQRDLGGRLWDYSARLHLRLTEEFPEVHQERIAAISTQLAVELLELDDSAD